MQVIASRAHLWLAALRVDRAANHAPVEPGFFAAARELFYVTARGTAYRVRDVDGRVGLVPVKALPVAVTPDFEAEEDRVVGLVVEADDALDPEAIDEGFHEFEGYLFRHGTDGTHFLYFVEREDRYRALQVLELPAAARPIDVVSAAARLALDEVLDPTPLGGSDHA